jgi:hypothetical protein
MRKENTYVANGHPFRRWACCAALALVPLISHAKAGREWDAWAAMSNSSGTSHTVSFGTNGQPLSTVPTSTGATRAGNMSFSHGAGQWPKASGTMNMPSPLGKDLPVKATQAFTKASAAKALASAVGKAFWPLAAGIALYDLLMEKGLTPEDAEGDAGWIVKKYTNGSTTEFGVTHSGGRWGGWASSKEGACTSAQADYNAQNYPYFIASTAWAERPAYPQTGVCTFFANWKSNGQPYGWLSEAPVQTRTVTSETVRTLSTQEIEDAIAAESGWPSSSAISRALADAVNLGETLVPEGVPTLEPQAQRVEGPTKTTTRSDGSSTTEQTVCDWIIPFGGTLQYQCSTKTTDLVVTATPVTTTNPDGSTSTSMQTATKTLTAVVTGSDGKPVAPNSIELDVPNQDVPGREVNVTFTPQDLGLGNGSCPSPVSVSTTRGNIGWDYAPACDFIVTWIKPLVLAFATLSAFFIIGGFSRPED